MLSELKSWSLVTSIVLERANFAESQGTMPSRRDATKNMVLVTCLTRVKEETCVPRHVAAESEHRSKYLVHFHRRTKKPEHSKTEL